MTSLPVASNKRQITIVFIDLVGSTELSQNLEPEQFFEVIKAFQVLIQNSISQFGGVVGKFLGDGALIYFGYPQAFENSAERGVLAALRTFELLHANLGFTKEAFGYELSLRIGINTGIVMVTSNEANGASPDMLGGPANLAARIQSLAPPNEILVSEDTYNLTSEKFEYEPMGAQELRGVSKLQKLFKVIKVIPRQTGKGQMNDRAKEMATYGRARDLEVCNQIWKEVKSGLPQVVVVTGNAGIGKSHFIKAFSKKVELEENSVGLFKFYCSSHMQSSSLHVLKDHFMWRLGFKSEDPTDEKTKKISHLLSQFDLLTTENINLMRVLVDALSIDLEWLQATSPAAIKSKFANLICDFIFFEAAKGPVIITIEDVHWIDPSSNTVFEKLISRLSNQNILVLVTCRKPTEPNERHFFEAAKFKQIVLAPLTDLDVSNWVRQSLNLESDRSTFEDILHKSQGMPLFLSEILKNLPSLKAAGTKQKMEVPASLRDSMIARFDGLSADARTFLSVASLVGRNFNGSLVGAVLGLSKEEGQKNIDELVKKEIILKTRIEEDYLFHHVLFQEAVQETLPKNHTKALHIQIIEQLEKTTPNFRLLNPEVLAKHYQAAEEFSLAAQLYYRAAESSLKKAALQECVNLSTEGIEVCNRKPSHEALRLESQFHVLIMFAFFGLKGWGYEKLPSHYNRVLKINEILKDPQIEFQGLWVCRAYLLCMGELHEQAALAVKMLAIAEQLNDRNLIVASYLALTTGHSFAAQPTQCIKAAENLNALYNKKEDELLRLKYGTDPYTLANSHHSLNYWVIGRPEKALSIGSEVLQHAKNLGVQYEIAIAQAWCLSLLHYFRGDSDAVLIQASEAIEICEAQELSLLLAYSKCLCGWAQVEKKLTAEGLRSLENGIEQWRILDIKLASGFLNSLYGIALSRANRHSDADRITRPWLQHMEQDKETSYKVQYYLNFGEILNNAGDKKEARHYLNLAWETARVWQSSGWLLKSSVVLAEDFIASGEIDKARTTMSAVPEFSEGSNEPLWKRYLEIKKNLLTV